MAGWRNRTRHVRQRTEQRLDKKGIFTWSRPCAKPTVWVNRVDFGTTTLRFYCNLEVRLRTQGFSSTPISKILYWMGLLI
jgi:hypothetical protein